MIKKVFTIVICVFLARLLASCCECSEVPSYKIKYSSVTTDLINTAGIDNVVVVDVVSRYSFGMVITPQFELLEAKCAINPFTKFGFNTAMACSCPGKTYNVIHSIEHINIYMIEHSVKTDVTQYFDRVDSNDLPPSFESKEIPSPEDFALSYELNNPQIVSEISSFYIEIILESGEVLSNKTAQITFND